MRICKDGILLVKPGTVPAGRQEKKQKKERPLTAAQRKRVEELRKKIAEGNQAGICIKSAEIR